MSTSPRRLLSLSGYASEGGLDGRYQPATCYLPTIALGRHPGPGATEGLWDNYEAVIDVASEVGIEGICLEISWARLEPRRGQRDLHALARYGDVIAHAQARGLWVTVAAIDAAWPAWLGLEAWLMPWATAVAGEYVQWIVTALPGDALSVFAARNLLTRGFLDARAGPPWRRHATEDERCASENLDAIERIAHDVAPIPVVTSHNIDLDDFDDLSMASTSFDEVHLRSLVRGSGPLAARRGLIARRGDEWVVADRDLARRLGERS